MKCKRCGSYAINHKLHGRDGADPDLCDVCYWRKRAEEEKVLFIPIDKSLVEYGRRKRREKENDLRTNMEKAPE